MATQKTKSMSTEATQRKTNHLLHIILSVMTGGLWLPIWLLVWLGGSVRLTSVVLALILVSLVYFL